MKEKPLEELLSVKIYHNAENVDLLIPVAALTYFDASIIFFVLRTLACKTLRKAMALVKATSILMTFGLKLGRMTML